MRIKLVALIIFFGMSWLKKIDIDVIDSHFDQYSLYEFRIKVYLPSRSEIDTHWPISNSEIDCKTSDNFTKTY